MRQLFIFVFIVAVFALWGCDANGAPKPPQMARSSPEANVHADASASPANKIDELSKTIVDFGNNNPLLVSIPRDPFSSAQGQQTLLSDLEQEDNLCEDLLCGFDISQLSLVAVISGDANPVAMLEDTQGVGYIVRKNSRIGKLGGRISSIYQNCLVVSEPSQDMKSGVKDLILCVKSENMNSSSVDLMSNSQAQ
jgi:type IV pilus assembly protein PilP